MASIKKTPVQQQAAFVDRKSLKNYASATAALTVVINIILYIYSIYKQQNMPNTVLLPIAIGLSVLYVLSFFAKEPETTAAQYSWITVLNATMLFTSISGTNGILEEMRKSYVDQNKAHNNIKNASIIDVVKHVIFPTHGWFTTTEVHNDLNKQVLHNTIAAIDTAQALITHLVQQKTADSIAIDTLTENVITLRSRYIQALETNIKSDSALYRLNLLLSQVPEVTNNVSPDVSKINNVNTSAVQLKQHREVQKQQQQILQIQHQQQPQHQQQEQQQQQQIQHKIQQVQQQQQQLQQFKRKLSTAAVQQQQQKN